MNDYEKQVFRSAISKYGETNQSIVAIEEMSELIKALCKKLRGKPDFENIAEEMADAGIMLVSCWISCPSWSRTQTGCGSAGMKRYAA